MPSFTAALAAEYARLWATMTVRPDKAATVAAIARRLHASKARYQAVERKAGVPWFMIAALHNRESSGNFATYLGNGEPLKRVTRLVPKGRGPFASWEGGAADALVVLKALDKVKDWSPERICYEVERFNGFGYRTHHPNVLSPYLWSFSNHYTRGKYVADGRFSATHADQQCGAIPLVKALIALDSRARPGPAGQTPKTATKTETE